MKFRTKLWSQIFVLAIIFMIKISQQKFFFFKNTDFFELWPKIKNNFNQKIENQAS